VVVSRFDIQEFQVLKYLQLFCRSHGSLNGCVLTLFATCRLLEDSPVLLACLLDVRAKRGKTIGGWDAFAEKGGASASC